MSRQPPAPQLCGSIPRIPIAPEHHVTMCRYDRSRWGGRNVPDTYAESAVVTEGIVRACDADQQQRGTVAHGPAWKTAAIDRRLRALEEKGDPSDATPEDLPLDQGC
jgi:hypothetical protein